MLRHSILLLPCFVCILHFQTCENGAWPFGLSGRDSRHQPNKAGDYWSQQFWGWPNIWDRRSYCCCLSWTSLPWSAALSWVLVPCWILHTNSVSISIQKHPNPSIGAHFKQLICRQGGQVLYRKITRKLSETSRTISRKLSNNSRRVDTQALVGVPTTKDPVKPILKERRRKITEARLFQTHIASERQNTKNERIETVSHGYHNHADAFNSTTHQGPTSSTPYISRLNPWWHNWGNRAHFQTNVCDNKCTGQSFSKLLKIASCLLS